MPRPGVGGAAVQRQDGGAVVVAAVRLAQLVAQHVAHPGRGVAEELRQGPHRLAAGVDPEAVLVLEDLEVELLDDVVGLRERLQAGVPAVQEATGVAHQAVAGELQQPLPGLGVARHGPLQTAPAGRRSIRRSPATLPSLRPTSAAPQFIRTGGGGPEKNPWRSRTGAE